MGILAGHEPEAVLRYFEEIASIPHGSTNTKGISDYCVSFAKKHGLEYYQDKSNNIVIWKDGTKGYEDRPYVMLQGHLDMVCEKEAYSDIDFERDGLVLELKDDILSASGTTLGGDDGIAIAYALALLSSDDIPHPPIEAVFTTDEEIGMLGANALDMSILRSANMINLDSEDEGYLLVSCAGGATAVCELPVTREDYDGIMLTISVDGLLGGHSGQEIDKGRASSNSLIGRLLSYVNRSTDFRLVTVSGGNKDNAIPRASYAVISVRDEVCREKAVNAVNELAAVIANEYHLTDPSISIRVQACTDCESRPMDEASTMRAVHMLRLFPQGVQRMSASIPGLVETSLNLGILKDEGDRLSAAFSVRSSVNSEKDELNDRLMNIMESLSGSMTLKGVYPAWEYNEDSKLQRIMTDTFRELYGREMKVQAIHAGVECGLFADSVKGLDAVSIGPDMKDIHTPKETLDISSVKRTWDYILRVLEKL
ncbi:MAG TPA: aminoacyl-histidine dipeptidase [Lachnospiraceae bacterium]|nr:aminoacyl-histidine dipeptidase [Lachnospiraceae bacterium]